MGLLECKWAAEKSAGTVRDAKSSMNQDLWNPLLLFQHKAYKLDGLRKFPMSEISASGKVIIGIGINKSSNLTLVYSNDFVP